MKRIDKQKRLATAAKAVATKFKNNTLTFNLPAFGYALNAGAPETAIGAVVKIAGFAPKTKTIGNDTSAVAKALGTSVETLPANVRQAIDAVNNAQSTASRGGAVRRRATVVPLRAFAEAIASTKIRKQYTRTVGTTTGGGVVSVGGAY